jgi:hypothetical protein
MNTGDNSISSSLESLEALRDDHVAIAKSMTQAYGGAMYGLDLLAYGALNRSRAHLTGFTSLVRARNLLCAGALLRLQLDTVLRFSAAWLVTDPHDFALDVLRGTRVRNLTDRSGKKMTDAYLVQMLSRDFDWVERVYERTSGYVHFSNVHMLSAITSAEDEGGDRILELKISDMDKPLPEELYLEAIEAFAECTHVLLWYVTGWAVTKAHPDSVARPAGE